MGCDFLIVVSQRFEKLEKFFAGEGARCHTGA
jgi:hypothetical protein